MTLEAPESRELATATVQAHKDPALTPPPLFDTEAEWLDALRHFDAPQARSLLMLLRTLYPHDALHDRVYRRVVAVIDGVCAMQTSQAIGVARLLASLDQAFALPFAGLSESFRVLALKSHESLPAFRFLQRSAVRHLYDDLELWQAFGYEGASHHLGGFVDRGFDDLDWLPAPEPTR